MNAGLELCSDVLKSGASLQGKICQNSGCSNFSGHAKTFEALFLAA